MPQKSTTEALKHLETLFNYSFKDKSLLQEALHADGPFRINGRWVDDGNKRLAVVGDSAIGVCLSHSSYHAGLTKGTYSYRLSALL